MKQFGPTRFLLQGYADRIAFNVMLLPQSGWKQDLAAIKNEPLHKHLSGVHVVTDPRPVISRVARKTAASDEDLQPGLDIQNPVRVKV